MIRTFFLFIFIALLFIPFTAKGADNSGIERAKMLKEFIAREKTEYERRENERVDVTEDLDKLNSEQNAAREKLSVISANQQEMAMALENISVEVDKQKRLERAERQRLYLLLRIVYRIKKDGILRFVINGDNLSELAGRIRVLYRTLRSHTQITKQLAERAERLQESEKKMERARVELANIAYELKDHQDLLLSLLGKKRLVLQELANKQTGYRLALHEYQRISKQLATLFEKLETPKKKKIQAPTLAKHSLPLPVDRGRLVKNFGKSIHREFKTVTYQKGIEIELEHNSPVKAILPGTVEYEGWVRGLGNVVIVHHGGRFHTLHAHLFKSALAQGTEVKTGDTIGYVGDTGNSDLPSLYFELRDNGKAMDPIAYFSHEAIKNLDKVALP